MWNKDLRICELCAQGVYVELLTRHLHWLSVFVSDSWTQDHGSMLCRRSLFCIQCKVNLGTF